MSQTVITLAFEHWKAQQAINNSAVVLDEFVLANVPNLDVERPIDRAEQLPEAKYIVHRQAVSAAGLVNENSVVYSVTMGADVGDFEFNWVGLTNKASGTLAMIVHAPLQSKIKNADGKQGNVLTRSFLMEYNGAASETQITTPAETWQIDFTARLAGMDERQRLENVDIYGAAAFFGDGFLVTRQVSQYSITQGIGYVGGLRCKLSTTQNITVTTKPVKVWADVCWKGTLTSVWAEELKITVANTLANYMQDDVQHYVFAVASIDSNGVITDLRPKGALSDQQANDALKKHEQSRNHPDGTVNAKGFVQLSSATNSDSEVFAATPKAVKAAYDLANGKYTAQDASTAQKGIVQLSSATNSPSETLAATPKAVKTAYDLANGKYTAQDATTTQKGIVQLNSATNSESETQAATPKAIKAANDNANGRLGKSSNLADLADKNTARKNISAIGFSNERFRDGADFNDAPQNSTSFVYPTAKNSPGFSGSVLDFSGLGGGYNVEISATYLTGGNRISFRTRNGDAGTWNQWFEIYHTGKKPTALDVGALPIVGGILNGNLTVKNQIQVGGVGNGVLNIGDSDSGLRSSADGQVDLYANGAFRGYWNTTTFSFTGQIIPTNYANFDAKYQAKGSYTPAGQAYTKAESDGRFQPKGSYTPAGQAYTKAESDNLFQLKIPASGGVGTYAFARIESGNTSIGFGANIAGSVLRASCGDGTVGGSALAGTWRCCGATWGSAWNSRVTLWIRIA